VDWFLLVDWFLKTVVSVQKELLRPQVGLSRQRLFL